MLANQRLLTSPLKKVALKCYLVTTMIEPHQPVKPAYQSRARIFLAKDGWIELRPGTPRGALDRIGKLFFDEIEFRRSERKEGRKTDDRLTPMEWLRVSLYSVILTWFGHEEGKELDARVPIKKINSKAIQTKASVEFHMAIAGIFADYPQALKPTERDRLADPMWHAFRHYIPPELILGFNAQYPAHEKDNNAVLGEIEPALVAWVKEQRVLAALGNRDVIERRGQYPRDIQGFVEDSLDQHHEYIVERRQMRRNNHSVSDDWPE